MYGADIMNEEEFNEKIAEMEGPITCAELCVIVDFIKEHGTAAQLARACEIAENKGCECDACEPSTGGPG